MAVIQEIGDEAGAAWGPHLAGGHRGHDRGHDAARGARGAVELRAVRRVVVRHAEDVPCAGTGPSAPPGGLGRGWGPCLCVVPSPPRCSPSSWAAVRADCSPSSSTMAQLRSGSQAVPTSAMPRVSHVVAPHRSWGGCTGLRGGVLEHPDTHGCPTEPACTLRSWGHPHGWRGPRDPQKPKVSGMRFRGPASTQIPKKHPQDPTSTQMPRWAPKGSCPAPKLSGMGSGNPISTQIPRTPQGPNQHPSTPGTPRTHPTPQNPRGPTPSTRTPRDRPRAPCQHPNTFGGHPGTQPPPTHHPAARPRCPPAA